MSDDPRAGRQPKGKPASATATARVQASSADALDHAARARLAAIVTASNDAIIGETLDGVITDWNPAAERLYGYTAAEAIGQPLTMLAPPGREDEIAELVARGGRGERIAELEAVRQTKDGRLVDISVSISPVRDDDGRLIGVSGISRDISARKAAEAERAAIHLHTRQVLERITDSFYALDREFRFTYVNESMEQVVGRSRADLLGKTLWTEFPEFAQTAMYDVFQAAQADGAARTAELYYPPYDSWYEVRIFPSPEGLSVFFRDITESRRLTEALRESEEKYRTLIDHLPAVAYVKAADEEQTAQFFSPQVEAMTGYSVEETLAATTEWLERVHPADRPRVADEHAESFGSGRAFSTEYRYLRKDGRVIWVRDGHAPLRDESGQVVAWHGVLQDITERVEAEATRRESEARFRAVWEATADAITLSDPEGIVVAANPAFCALFGYPEAAIVGQPYSVIFPDEERASVWAQYREVFSDPRLRLDYVSTAQRSDGTWRDIEVRIGFIVVDGQRQLMISSIRDVTERARLVTELRESEAKFRSLVDHLPALVYVLKADERQTPLYFSPYLEALTGYTPEEALARDDHWLERVHPDDRERVRDADARATAEDAPLRIEYRYLRKDGSAVWVLDDSIPIRDDTGATVAFQGVLMDITDRVLAQEEQARLAAIVESAEDAIYSATRDGTITSWNRGAERLFGYAAEEAIGQSVMMLRSPAQPDDITHLVEGAWRGQRSEGHETVRLTKDGRLLDVSVAISPVRDASGEVVAVSSITRDISALRAAERALRLRDRALAAAASGIVITDPTQPDNPIVDVNPAFTALTGYGREEALGRNCRFLQCPGTDPAAVRRVREAIAAGRDGAETLLNVRKDGSRFWNDLHIAAVRDEAGALTHFVGVQTDVTERVEAAATRARLAAIVESAEDAIMSRTLDGIITSWNRGAERLYGYRADEAIGRSFTMLLPDFDDPITPEVIRQSNTPRRRFATKRRRKDGSLVDVSIAISPIVDDDGVTIGVASIARDIGDRIALEQELRTALEAAEAAAETKSLFLSIMSHELRTPLQAVLGYADFLLLNDDSLAAEQREDLRYIHGGATRMMTLINQVIDLSRMEAGGLELAAEAVDLGEVIEQVRQDVAPQAAAKGLELAVDVPPTLPRLVGDAERLRQAVLNLAGNAVKFTDAGVVRITAGAGDAGRELTVAVSDTGPGIAPEALPHIFEEFRQASGIMTRRHEGAGLGLAITRRLIEQMGGRVTVESSPGVGSTFTLRLPAADGGDWVTG